MAINPLQPPINYAGMVPQINIGQQFAELGQVLAERQKRIQAEKIKEEYKTDLEAAIANPTQETWSNMIAKYPQQREAFAEVRKQYGEVAVRNESNMGMEVSMALENNNPEVATQKLMKIISALENSGRPTGVYQQALNQLELGNIKGAQAGVNLGLAFLDPDNFKKIVDARTAALKAPSEVTEAAGKAAKAKAEGDVAAGAVEADITKRKADAEKALSDATTALATADNAQAKAEAERKLAQAQAEVGQINAEYARTNAVLDVRQKGVQLGLTEAQIKQAEASIAASNAAAKKDGAEAARLEAQAKQIADGIIPNEKRPEAERNFRNEYNDRTKTYQDTKSAYTKILAVSDPKTPDEEAAADIALIFNFMKMQDPSSTISTGEYANAQNAAGVADKVVNIYNNLLKGSKLSPTQRKAFRGQAENLYKAAGQQEDIVRKGIERIAKGMGLNTENIFYTPTEVAPTAVSGTPAANPDTVKVGDMTYTRPANFTDKQWSDYKQNVGAK
jgi:hypothetical protein